MSLRVGIFGGTFNPVHVGHVNSVETILKKFNLSKVFVVPARENPLKKWVDGPKPEERLEMVRLAFDDLKPTVEVDDQEIQREGPSYTVETLRNYAEKFPPEDLFLIVGADQIEHFDQWKEFETILELANLLVTTRPGSDLPQTPEDLPLGMQKLIQQFDRNFIHLKSDRFIEFVRLQDVDVSATEIRKRLRANRPVSQFLLPSVEEYIIEHGLYQPLGPKIGDWSEFTRFCANVLFARKAINVRAFDLQNLETPSEFTLIASGTSTRHASSLAELVVHQVRDEYGVLPQSVEGITEGRWVVLDYGSLIIHVFYDYVRNQYELEKLWQQGAEMPLQDPALR